MHLLTLAVELAREAGAHARGGRERARTATSVKSTPTDMVTALDKEVEQLLIDRITAERGADDIVGEETGTHAAVVTDSAGPGPGDRARIRWILDPIDGTVNYVYGQPHYAVSIAAYRDEQPLVGVVCNPATHELWQAAAGLGAWRGTHRLRGTDCRMLSQALVGTGFAYDAAARQRQGQLVARLLPQVRDIRRAGSCALDLCYAAEGRLDAYYESGVNLWDAAAGALIAIEAGLRVSGLGGQPWDQQMVLAAPPALHPMLDAALQAAG